MKTKPIKKLGVRGKIDKELVIQALGKGLSKTKAGILAGSKSQDAPTIIHGVDDCLRNDTQAKKRIEDLLEEKRRLVISKMTPAKAEKQNFVQLATSCGILTDKIELIKGNPTNRIELIPRMVITETKQLPPAKE